MRYERFESKTVVDIGLIGLIAVGCILPAILIGPPIGTGDLQHHLQIASAYADSFRSGVLFPSWVDAENNGYGSVTVRLYPPLAHYTIAICKLMFGSWHIATFAAFAIWSYVGSLGVYLWSKSIFNDRSAALVSAVLFAITPYHLNQYFNSFMWGEYVALSVLPFAFHYARRIMLRGDLVDIAAFGTTYALLVLSNIPQLVIGSIGIALYVLCLCRRQLCISSIVKMLASAVIGLLLSAYYWVRMVAGMSWIVISQPNTDPWFDFRNNFLLTGLTYDDQFLWFASFFFIISTVSIIVAFVAIGSIKKILHNQETRAITAICIVAIILMLPASRLLWEILTPIQRVQFPWRFLSLLGLGSALLVGYAFLEVKLETIGSPRPRLIILVGLIVITATFSIKQIILGAVYSDPISYDTAAMSSKNKLGLDHWHPTWMSAESFQPPEPVQSSRPVAVTKWNGTDRRFTVEPGVPETIRLGLMYYPHWRINVNGQAIETLESKGAVSAKVGQEKSSIEVNFVEPLYASVSLNISFLTSLALLVGFIYRQARTLNSNSSIR